MQGGEVLASGEQLVDVGLVPGVPEQDVAWAVEDPVEGDRQLDDAQVGTEVSAGARDVLDQEVADLGGQRLELVGVERLDVSRCHDLGEQRHRKCPSQPVIAWAASVADLALSLGPPDHSGAPSTRFTGAVRTPLRAGRG